MLIGLYKTLFPFTGFIKNIYFIDTNTAISSDNSNLYKTTDSGITWTLQNTVLNLSLISFVNSSVGYYTSGNSLYKPMIQCQLDFTKYCH